MLTTLIYRSHIRDDEPVKKIEEMVSIANRRNMQSDVTGILLFNGLNRPGFPGECFICELRLPDHYFRWKHNKL
ncbi:BLUF domain-containing protein, partial [Escherichia coli]